MVYYSVLLISLLIIIFLCFKLWKLTKDFSIILGISLIYYWTLAGAWFFIGDQLSGEAGKDYGLHYYYLFLRMFEVHVDKYYLYSIIFYSVFIITIQLTLLLFINNKKLNQKQSDTLVAPYRINHVYIIIITVLSVFISFYILRNEIIYSLSHNLSVYTITRNTTSRFFTIHQIFNLIAVFSLIFGIVTYLSGKHGVYIYSDKNFIITILYIVLTFMVIIYLSMLGNKHELMFSGIFGILFIVINNRKYIFGKIILMLAIIVIPLYLNDASRILTPQFASAVSRHFSSKQFDLSQGASNPGPDYSSALKSTSLSFFFSNEMFCAHFSMYGVLKHNVPLTYGSSVKSFFASLLPKIIYRNRPQDIYTYYAGQMKLKEGQGYTINHATGWYLNFGILGIIGGAVIFGLIWALSRNCSFIRIIRENKYLLLISRIMPALFVACIPFIIRTGPEGYKTLIFEAFLIPFLIIILSVSSSMRSRSLK